MNKIFNTMIKYKAVVAVAFVFALGALVAPTPAAAVLSAEEARGSFGLDAVGDPAALGGTLGNKGLVETITGIIKIGLSLLGIIAVVIILAGGFKWMTAGGNEDKVGEARKMIISGVIGLAIIMSAFAIAQFVIGSLAQQTGAGTDAATMEAP